MEISVIGRISELEVNMSDWGALYIAFIAALISIFVTRIRYMILKHRRSPASSTEICSGDFDDDFSDLDDEDFDDDDDISVSSSEDEESDTESRETDEEVRSKLQRGFSWSDFTKGKSVVKLWDGIGLGLDFNQSSGGLISLYDLDREKRITSVFNKCKLPSIARPSTSPSVVISASRRSFTAWDSHDGTKSPCIVAEWNEVGPIRTRAPELVFGGVKKVYVGDRVSGVVTVSDSRKSESPLATGSEVETWWEDVE